MDAKTAFLELLNAKRVTGAQWRNLLAAEGEEVRQFKQSEAAAALTMLQGAVNFWIDTGFHPKGGEAPASRHFPTGELPEALLHIARLLNCDDPVSTEAGVWTFQASQHTKKNPLYGLLALRMEPHAGFRFAPVLFRNAWPGNMLAAWAFYFFWQQDTWRFRLMRCAECGIFSIPGRKPRKSYVRGWHCERCRDSASAKAATRRTRKKFRERVLASAVGAYLEYESEPRRTGNDLVQFLTDRVNAGLKPTNRIKRNTITHNLAAIRQKAKRQNRAKPQTEREVLR